MTKSYQLLGVLVLVIAGYATVAAKSAAQSPPPPGTGLPEALFGLKEMDMHLHAGVEREPPLNEWIDLAVQDGRKVIVLLDHLELYRKSPEEYKAWAEKEGRPQWYPVGREGHQALMGDFSKAAVERKDLILFRGWEIYEGELDTGIEAEPMRMAEVIGWHISPNNGGEAPNGALLIKRAKQIKEIQKQFPIPMILYHPFTMRIENLQRTAQKQGRDPKTLTVEEYRFFRPGEQEELAGVLKGSSVYVEMARGSQQCWENPTMREALIADIKPLAEAGVQFIVSTDNHSVKAAKMEWNPEAYCADCGITPANTNTIVRELLALRAKHALEKPASK